MNKILETARNMDSYSLTIRDTVSESFTVFSHRTVDTVRLGAPSCYIVVGSVATGDRVLGSQTVVACKSHIEKIQSKNLHYEY